MVDRIKQVMEHYEETPAGFAEKIGVNRSNLTHLFSGRNQPSLDFAKKVLVAYPEVSTEWLIMGVGKMIKDPDEAPVVKREFIQTDLFDALDEDETPQAEPEPEPEVEMVEESITNGTENDIQEASEEIPTDEVKTEEEEITPSEEVEEVETEVVNPVEQPVVTSPESNIPKRAVHPSGKSNSRTVEKATAKPAPSHSATQPTEKLVTSPVEKPQPRPVATPVERPRPVSVERPVATPVERPRPVSAERPVATPVDRPRTVSMERPVAAHTEQAPAPREKKIEKIIFFYDDDSFKVYHP